MNIKTRLSLILTEDEIRRLKADSNKERLTVDLHGLSVKDAKKLINNLININRDKAEITCIHGYNHGTSIKEMVQKELNNPRVTRKFSPSWNPGITTLMVAAA